MVLIEFLRISTVGVLGVFGSEISCISRGLFVLQLRFSIRYDYDTCSADLSMRVFGF